MELVAWAVGRSLLVFDGVFGILGILPCFREVFFFGIVYSEWMVFDRGVLPYCGKGWRCYVFVFCDINLMLSMPCGCMTCISALVLVLIPYCLTTDRGILNDLRGFEG